MAKRLEDDRMVCGSLRRRLFALLIFISTTAVARSSEKYVVPQDIAAVLRKSCTDCHGADLVEGEVRLDGIASLDQEVRLDLLNKVQEQLYLGQMPPRDAQQPSAMERSQLADWAARELHRFKVSELETKLQKPEYGNYVEHEKLFSGEFQDLPGFTFDRRWLISEYIFNAKFQRLADLYRDEIHLTHEAGKYLMHNAMRRALGQPALVAGFEKLDAEVRKYLDGVLAQLETSPADKTLLTQILSMEENVDRAALIAKVSDKTLQSRLVALLPDIERAAQARRATLALEAETRPSSVHHDFSKISLVVGARDVDAGGESQCVRDRRLRKHRGSRGLVYRRRGHPRPLDNTG